MSLFINSNLFLFERGLFINEPITVAVTVSTYIIHTCLKTIHPDIIFIRQGNWLSKKRFTQGWICAVAARI